MDPLRKGVAEAIGTFWLVFGGVGSAVLAGQHIGVLGISLAFGLTVVTMAYAIGHISGCHLNPAVSVGLVVSGRMPARELPVYIGAQVAGAIVASLLLMILVKNGEAGLWAKVEAAGFAANGYGEHSPGGYGMVAALITEVVLTCVFLLVILGATDGKASAGFAGLAIGLCLTLIHLVGIPVTNLSVNPARSTGPALFVGGWAIGQLWLFWMAPMLGATLAGFMHRHLFASR